MSNNPNVKKVEDRLDFEKLMEEKGYSVTRSPIDKNRYLSEFTQNRWNIWQEYTEYHASKSVKKSEKDSPCPYCGHPPKVHFEKETYRDIYTCSNGECFNYLELTEEDWNTRRTK